jgi:hypothetical protein
MTCCSLQDGHKCEQQCSAYFVTQLCWHGSRFMGLIKCHQAIQQDIIEMEGNKGLFISHFSLFPQERSRIHLLLQR